MSSHYVRVLFLIILLFLHGCGGGGNNDSNSPLTGDELQIAATPGDDGIFDPAPVWDGDSTLWMSHSSVNWSNDDPMLSQVHTRIAMSQDGDTWIDTGVDPNHSHLLPDFQVIDGAITYWATWRFEVSRLFHDPYDSDVNRRWKMLWHRVLAIGNPTPAALFQNSWIGYSSASSPDASWSDERKLFTGVFYNGTDMDQIIGPPEFPLDTIFNTELGGCTLFTEPGVLARNEGIYISLHCTGENKIVLLRCDRSFSSCTYLGDLLTATDAAPLSLEDQPIDFFSAPELVDSPTTTYLIVTGVEDVDETHNRYNGCLVFRVSDLENADVERLNGEPVLVTRVNGSSGSFNGACGYEPHDTSDGIIYSELTPISSPRFHLFSSQVTLP